jgi:hypothetical protein
MNAAALWGRGVRKSCGYTIGVGRWTERYMDDVYEAVPACQEPVKPMACDLSKQACER